MSHMERPKTEYGKIQVNTLGTLIGYRDIVSGAFFHKFVKEYHAYDRRQKDIIKSLQEENEQLREERDRYMHDLASIADTESNRRGRDPKDKIKRQKSMISQLLLQNIRLKEQLQKSADTLRTKIIQTSTH